VLLILEQQVSIDSAKATFKKLREEIKIFDPAKILWIYRIRNLEYWRKPAKNILYQSIVICCN
jgi:hypothetical protein